MKSILILTALLAWPVRADIGDNLHDPVQLPVRNFEKNKKEKPKPVTVTEGDPPGTVQTHTGCIGGVLVPHGDALYCEPEQKPLTSESPDPKLSQCPEHLKAHPDAISCPTDDLESHFAKPLKTRWEVLKTDGGQEYWKCMTKCIDSVDNLTCLRCYGLKDAPKKIELCLRSDGQLCGWR